MSFANLLSFAQLPSVGSIASTIGQLQQLTAAGGGPGQLGSMAGQQAQMISAQAQQGGQQQATLVGDKKEEEEEGAGAGTPGAGAHPSTPAVASSDSREPSFNPARPNQSKP